MQSLTQELVLEGFDVQQLLVQLMDQINANGKVADMKKAKIAEIIGDTDVKIIQGGDEELNLMHTLVSIAGVMKQNYD